MRAWLIFSWAVNNLPTFEVSWDPGSSPQTNPATKQRHGLSVSLFHVTGMLFNTEWNRLRLLQLRNTGMYADLQNARERRQFYSAFQQIGTEWRMCTVVMQLFYLCFTLVCSHVRTETKNSCCFPGISPNGKHNRWTFGKWAACKKGTWDHYCRNKGSIHDPWMRRK
jgi:hypothetical protein